jgi:hypothetical protein
MVFEKSRYMEAERLYLAAIDTQRKIYGSEHSALGVTLHNLAQLCVKRKRWARAVKDLGEAVTIFRGALGKHIITFIRLHHVLFGNCDTGREHPMTQASQSALDEIEKHSKFLLFLIVYLIFV